MTKLMLTCALLLVGCADLQSFDSECGNFEIDPGEDCDEGVAGTERCDGCRVVCDELRTCHEFPGYACGADGYCRAPSGRLAETSTERATLAHSFTVTDVDRDFYADVVSVSGTSLSVNFGDPAGDLSLQSSTLVPTLGGEPSFIDIDGDGSTDVVAPTADGVAAYSSRYAVLSPHSFAIALEQGACPDRETLEGQPFHVLPLDDNRVVVLISRMGTNKLGIAVINTNDKDICADLDSAKQVCDVFVGATTMSVGDQTLVFGFSEYDTSTATSRGKMIAVTSALPNGGSCVIDMQRDKTATEYTSRVVFSDRTVNRPSVLADIDGTGCPSLIDSISDPIAVPRPREFRAQGVPGACAIAAAPTPFPLPTGSFAVGAVRYDPVTSPDALSRDAIVTTDGVYAIRTTRVGGQMLYLSDRPLTSATSADIDADGDLDLIAYAEGAEDIDLIERASNDNFLLLRLDTVGAVTLSAVADFDGNGIPDIAYAESFVGSQQLNIAYGTRDRPLAPVEAGTFANVVGLLPSQFEDSTDPNGIVDDLIILDILDPATSLTPVMTLLHGSPQRTMQSFFDPRIVGASSKTVFTGVAAGNFFPTQGAGPYVDLIAIDGARTGPAGVWPLQGTAYGAFSYSSSSEVQGTLGSCLPSTAGSAGAYQPAFCTNTARYTSWPRAGDNDLVIGIDNSMERHVVVLDPISPGTASTPPASTVVTMPLPGVAAFTKQEVRSLHVADLDGDGRRELVVALGPGLRDLAAAQGAILRCEMTDAGVPTACTNLAAEIPALAGLGCVDATLARVTPVGVPGPPLVEPQADAPPASDDLVVVCHRDLPVTDVNGAMTMMTFSELFRVHHDATGFHADSLTFQLGSIENIEAGDVTGDGLDDILGIRINRTSVPSLVVFPQCASSDLVCGAVFVPQGETP